MGKKKRIGILTSGGDAPGLNAFIAGATIGGTNRGWEIVGIRNGFSGLLNSHNTFSLHPEMVQRITPLGGTILGASNNVDPYKVMVEGHPRDRHMEVIENAKKLKLDALLVAGGDGSLAVSHLLAEEGLQIVGVPKTIDNDVPGSDLSIGFLSAVATASRAAESLRNTGLSHQRCMLLEVMGRNTGWIALYSGLAATADVILIPEVPHTLESLTEKLSSIHKDPNAASIVMVAEGVTKTEGGAGNYVRNQLSKKLNVGVRLTVLGHLQRGGNPVSQDRIFAQACASRALEMIEREEFNSYVVFSEGKFSSKTLTGGDKNFRPIPQEDHILKAAKGVGISFAEPSS